MPLFLRRADRRTGDVADVAAAARRRATPGRPASRTPAAVRVGKAGDLLRPADADRPAEHALHVIGDILELGAAAGQHHLAADRPGEAEALQRGLDLIGQFLDALADDHHQLGAGHLHRLGALLRADLRRLDHLVIVARGRHRRAVEAFEPLGVAALDGEGGGDVVGDVLRAERDRAQPDQHSAVMDGDVGHFGAHFDQRDAELALLVAEAGERGGDRRRDDGSDAEMRLADHRIDIAQRRRLGGDDVDVDAEAVGVEPDRLLHALRAVDGVERRMGVEDDLAVLVDRVLAGVRAAGRCPPARSDGRQARPRHWRRR